MKIFFCLKKCVIDIDLFYNYVETIYDAICIIYKNYVIELIIKEKLEYWRQLKYGEKRIDKGKQVG